MSPTSTLIKACYEGIIRTSGKAPDCVVVGSDKRAADVLEALEELKLDLHVIADDGLGPNTVLVTHTDDLAKFPGGGRN